MRPSPFRAGRPAGLRSRRWFVTPLLLIPAACGSPARAQPDAAASRPAGDPEIRAAEIQAHVDHLASDALEGRSAKHAGGRLAAEYVAACFARYGLEPLGDEGGFLQAVGDISPNVVGAVRGAGERFVVIGAHYDHIPPREDAPEGADRIFNGADDNASGVAALLELAQAFAAGAAPPQTIVLVAFTGEELGLAGSSHFVEHPPFELSQVLGFYNLDMISRGEENLIFCENGPKAPRMLGGVRRANADVGLEIRYDFHPEWLSMSDHYAFIKKGVPALYFGVEDHVDYHQVSDHADRILPGLAARVARLVYLAARDLAAGEGGARPASARH